MAINKITAKSIKDAEIVAADIAPGTITDAKIATGTITNAKLAGSIANAKLANSAITINGTAINLGASGEIVAGTDWQAVTVADGSTTLTAEAGKGYFLDTNAGVIEVFLPTSPSRGDTILVADYAGHFALNNVIINTGTNNLDSTTTRQYKLTTNDTVAEFVYVDSAKGWITRILQAAGTTPGGVFTDGVYDTDTSFISATGGTITTVDTNFKVHSFTGDGNFVVSSGTGPLATVDYIVVAGGGGSVRDRSGGGGAGGVRESHSTPVSGPYTASPLATPTGIPLSPGTYPITVGAGGAASCNVNTENPGSNSVFSTITSTGGGAGGRAPGTVGVGLTGGSGGGSGSTAPHTPRAGGAGNTPPVSPPQGQPGGASHNQSSPYATGGGGGATQAGGNATGDPGGAGGNGATTNITGSPVVYGGGGGGGTDVDPGSAAQGGAGGGGNGAFGPTGGGSGTAAQAGGANTGGGAGGSNGGGNGQVGKAGGKGVVIIRYKFQ